MAPYLKLKDRQISTDEEALGPSEDAGFQYDKLGSKSDETPSTNRRCKRIPTWLPAEIKEVFNLSWTMVAIFVMNAVQQAISMLFSGHLGKKELGGVALANTIFKVAAVTIGNGLATACDTLFSQTYGSGNLKQVGMYLQRSFMVITLSAIPCSAILLNANGVLRLAGQDPEVASIAGEFCTVMVPAIFANHWYTILARYVRNQGIMYPLMFICLVALGINALSQYLLVEYFDIGVLGSAISMFLGLLFQFTVVLAYILISGMYKSSWGGLTLDALQGWGPFLRLAIFGLLNVNLLWMGFEIGTVVAGTLGDVILGAQSIIFQMEMITYCFAIGTGVGGNIRVGQLLGANNPNQAKRAVKAIYIIVLLQSLLLIVVLISLKDFIPAAFSSDPEIIKTASDVIPILALYTAFDQICGASSGILRGCGRQGRAALIIFVGMYLVGLPVGLSLMILTSLGTAGFWWGTTLSMVIQSIFFFISVMRTDWEGEAMKAQIRAGVKNKVAAAAESAVDDEKTVLLPEKQSKPRLRQRHFTGEYDTSQPDIAKLPLLQTVKLSPKELVFRRGIVILACFLIFGVGLFCRFTFTFTFNSETIYQTLLCIPHNASNIIVNGTVFDVSNTTGMVNISLPLCTYNSTYNSTI